MIEDKKIYVASKAFIVNGSKFLAMHRKDTKEEWLELPGGRLEFGESLEDTLKREVFEETKLNIEQVKLLDTWNWVGENHEIAGVIYLCRIVEGNITLSEEHDYYKWLEIDDESMERIHTVFKEKLIKLDYEEVKTLIRDAKSKYRGIYNYPF
ncbi:NUDIX hydrolase [Clostridium hydrogeniformans]|uniref:NUDIX hydrolase n=1 Tax=Clostridium hydrogeniformans TaxID=349933 RepID=UPI00068CA020|nr:NUDIX domain-containing protein [Clostridium hydrogeniformans]